MITYLMSKLIIDQGLKCFGFFPPNFKVIATQILWERDLSARVVKEGRSEISPIPAFSTMNRLFRALYQIIGGRQM